MSLSTVAACSHSHLWHPFCSQQTSSEKAGKVVFLALGAVIAWMLYRAIKRSYTYKPEATPLPNLNNAPFLSKTSQKDDESSCESDDEISKLLEMTGVPLEIIKERAKLAGETIRGFIKVKDSLLKVMRRDWDKAAAEKITHVEVADHLQNIIEAARKTPGKAVPYDYTAKEGDPGNMPRFSVTFFKRDTHIDTDIFRTKDTDIGSSHEAVMILNIAIHGKFIRWTPVRARYIREYGLYSIGMELDTILEILKGKA